MRVIRGKTTLPTSAAGPLPNRIQAPKFPLSAGSPKSLNFLIYRIFPASEGYFWGLKRIFPRCQRN